MLEFFYLTPLPGSEDHLKLYKAGVPLDPDLNKYDLNHVCTGHPKMSREEWDQAYEMAWQRYYTTEHIETMLRRVASIARQREQRSVPDHLVQGIDRSRAHASA